MAMQRKPAKVIVDFPKEHEAVLALIADAASRTHLSTSADVMIDCYLSEDPALVKNYVEVTLLVAVQQVRKGLRSLHDEGQKGWRRAEDGLQAIAAILPDPAIAQLLYLVRNFSHIDADAPKIIVAISNVTQHVQAQLLSATKFLCHRADDLSLNLSNEFPFQVKVSV